MLPSNTEHQEYASPVELTHAIKCLWYDRRELGESGADFEVVPDGFAEIIFYFGSDCKIYNDGNLQLLPSPFMMGLLNSPVVFHSKKRLEIIGIRCYPWAIFDLLGFVPDSDGIRGISKHSIAELNPTLDKLVEVGNSKDAMECVRSYLLSIQSQTGFRKMLFKAGTAMQRSKGRLSVREVADASHTTVRTLERRFKESSGHTVKDVASLMRFEQVRNCLWLDPKANLSGLAYELGYADQSHMSREFKRYSGTTPGVFASKAGKDKRMLAERIVSFN